MIYPKDFINKIIQDKCLDVMKFIPDKSIDLIVTDPPYNISGLSSGVVLHGRDVNTKDFGDWDWNFNVKPIVKEFKRLLKPRGQIYIFTSEKLFVQYRLEMEKLKFHFRNLIVLQKTNPLPKMRQVSWRNATEYILYAGRQKTKKCNYTFNWLGQDKMINVFKTAILGGKERRQFGFHPTQKPLKIIEKLIRVSSNKNDIVLDPFLGSGTTALACQNLHRKFIGIEINQEYIKIANNRIRQKPML